MAKHRNNGVCLMLKLSPDQTLDYLRELFLG